MYNCCLHKLAWELKFENKTLKISYYVRQKYNDANSKRKTNNRVMSSKEKRRLHKQKYKGNFTCIMCNRTCTNYWNLKQHIQSSKHDDNMNDIYRL